MEFLRPLFIFYGLLLLSLCAGLLACVGAFISHRRYLWIVVASLSAILIGSWVNYHYQAVLWGSAQEVIWVTVVGLAPIALGSFSLVR